jgi:hypothetical protein
MRFISLISAILRILSHRKPSRGNIPLEKTASIQVAFPVVGQFEIPPLDGSGRSMPRLRYAKA